MKPLDLQSERYSPTGNLASEGVLNQLGRPNLEFLTVLIRETVQNSWDARISSTEPVRFGISGRTLTPEHIQFLKEVIFADEPDNIGLKSSLSLATEFRVLTIYDRGTTGLGGPTRADIPDTEGEGQNFVNFLRNVGQPPVRPFGGGTFGYGKAALYLASQLHTICVHTHCLFNGEIESRFIAAALGNRYEKRQGENTGLYTGRHWWGKYSSTFVEPVQGAEADMLANCLDMPAFITGERGTSILILQPVFGDQTPQQALNLMANALLWNFWPKMLAQNATEPPMQFQLSWENQRVVIPDPREYPPLDGFVRAMENLKKPLSDRPNTIFSKVVTIESQRPRKQLGLLSMHRFPTRNRQIQETGNEEMLVPVPKPSSHIALMRRAELVVKYLPGPALTTDQFEYAGVFMTDEQVDPVFAKAEPPTHDDWAFQSLEDRHQKTYVRVALRRIEEAINEFATPPPIQTASTIVTPLGLFADRLGGLLPGEEGPGADIQPPSGNGRTGSGKSSGNRPDRTKPGATGNESRAKIIFVDEGQLQFVENIPALLARFIVKSVPGSQGTMVRIMTGAILDDDEFEVEPPRNGVAPRILTWIGPNANQYPADQEIFVPATEKGEWQVAVSVPDEMILGVALSAREVWG